MRKVIEVSCLIFLNFLTYNPNLMIKLMESVTYNSKIDWWIPAIVVFSVACRSIGPILDGDFLPSLIVGVVELLIEILVFAGVKYEIKGNQLGIRNFFR